MSGEILQSLYLHNFSGVIDEVASNFSVVVM